MKQSNACIYAVTTAAILSLITVGTFYQVVLESDTSAPALQRLSPYIEYVSLKVKEWSAYGNAGFLGLVGVAATTLLVIGASLRERSSRLLWYSAALAVVAQFFLVDRDLCSAIGQALGLIPSNVFLHANRDDWQIAVPLGALFYALAIAVFIAATKKTESTTYDFGKSDCAGFRLGDLVALTGVFVIGLIFRSYALNVIADHFEGELSPYSAGATSIKGMLMANRGANGPWSPLGILYYIPIYITTKAFGTTLIALRLSSTLVGVFTIPFVYLLAARLSGRLGAILASALFALNCLHIGWSRTDIHPHGVTAWPTLLMCWFLLKAYDTRKLGWACGVALMMGLSWHQYPSGQSAVSIPVIALGLYWLVNRFSLPVSKGQTALIASGILLWIVGLPFSYWLADGRWTVLNPFTLTGPRTLWGSEGPPQSHLETAILVISTALKQFGDVLQGIFYRQPYMFHQEWIPYADAVFGRTVAWLQVPFLVLGFLLIVRSLRRFESAVLIGWLIAAILPGILSEHAYPKRLSTLFPALDIIAAMGMAALLRTLALQSGLRWRQALATTSIIVSLVAYCAFMSYAWFSGRYWRYGVPAEAAFAARLSQSITPGTIVIGDLNRSYEAGKYLYLTLDHLVAPENRPNLWLPATTPMLPTLIADPIAAPQHIASTMPYTWTKLRDQVDETTGNKNWTKVLFVLQSGPEDRAENFTNVELATNRCTNPTISRLERERSALNTLILIECQVSDLK